MIELTENVKNRFLTGYKIPITITVEPYFTDRLKSYDPFYDCISKYDLFKHEMTKYKTEEEFFSQYTSTKEAIMDYIKSTEGYNNFISSNINWEVDDKYKHLPSKDIYHHDNVGKKFLSVDMIKANFSSMYKYDPTIFKNISNWNEFVATFTDSQYFIDSKYIREVVFGNCNPKRQVTYEKYLMSQLLSSIDSIFFDSPDVVFFSNDEFIFDITNYKDVDKLVEFINNYTEIPVRVEIFTLYGIYNDVTNIGYLKKFDDGNVVVKKSTQTFMPCIIRTLRGEEITDSDLIFIFEKNLCKLMNKPNVIIRDTPI